MDNDGLAPRGGGDLVAGDIEKNIDQKWTVAAMGQPERRTCFDRSDNACPSEVLEIETTDATKGAVRSSQIGPRILQPYTCIDCYNTSQTTRIYHDQSNLLQHHQYCFCLTCHILSPPSAKHSNPLMLSSLRHQQHSQHSLMSAHRYKQGLTDPHTCTHHCHHASIYL